VEDRLMSAGLQERVETSGIGRIVISGALLFLLFATIVWNLPASEVKRVTVEAVRPVAMAIRLDQIWSVFAPNPRNHSMDLQARIRYADGTEEMWRFPHREDPILSGYRSARWEKWADNARLNRHRELWQPTAAWLARTHQDRGRPVEVTLIRRAAFNLPPGKGPNRRPWVEHSFFTLQVTPELLSGEERSLSMWSL
jgi:hypothetical protein